MSVRQLFNGAFTITLNSGFTKSKKRQPVYEEVFIYDEDNTHVVLQLLDTEYLDEWRLEDMINDDDLEPGDRYPHSRSAQHFNLYAFVKDYDAEPVELIQERAKIFETQIGYQDECDTDKRYMLATTCLHFAQQKKDLVLHAFMVTNTDDYQVRDNLYELTEMSMSILNTLKIVDFK